MRHALLVLLSVPSVVAQAQAPAWAWAKSIGANIFQHNEVGRGITTGPDGHVYAVGDFEEQVNFGPNLMGLPVNITSYGETDVYVMKLTPGGTTVWAKRLGGLEAEFGNAIAVDGSGNVYVAGSFAGTADFDPHIVNDHELTANGAYPDAFVCKLDTAGQLLWVAAVGGTNLDEAKGIGVDVDGNVFIAGNFRNSVDLDPGPDTLTMVSAGVRDVFVLKLDAAGALAWAGTMGGADDDRTVGLALDAYGNVYTTGFLEGPGDHDPGPGVFTLDPFGTLDNRDVYVTKLDNDGQFVWARQWGHTGDDEAFSICADEANNIYTLGHFQGTVDLDPGPGSLPFTTTNVSNHDVFVSKLNSAGDLVWAKVYGNGNPEQAYAITTDGDGHVYCTAWAQSQIDLDPGPGTFYWNPPDGADLYLSKLDVNGAFEWAVHYGSATMDQAWGVTVGPLDELYVTGAFGGPTMYFDSLTIDNPVPNGMTFNGFIARLGDMSVVIGSAPSMEGIAVYPDPASDRFTAACATCSGPLEVVLFAWDGTMVRRTKTSATSIEIAVHDLAPGSYLVHVRTADRFFRQRVVIMR